MQTWGSLATDKDFEDWTDRLVQEIYEYFAKLSKFKEWLEKEGKS